MQDIIQRYHIKKEGSKKYLYVDYRDTNVVASIADSPKVMAEIIGLLAKHQDIDIVVLLDVYEKMYDERQTKMLKEVASLYVKYHKVGIWSPKYLGNIEKELPKRHRIIITVTHNLLRTDPVKAYIFLVESIKEEKQRLSLLEGNYKEDLLTFISTLETIKKDFDNLELIKVFKNYLKDTGEMPIGRSLYHTIFEPILKPAFVSSKVFFRLPEQIELLDMYEIESAKVKILKHPDRIDVLYFLEPPEYNLDPDKYFLMIKAKNIVSQHHPEGLDFSDTSRVREEMINIYEKTIEGLANMMKLKITCKEISELAKIVARYTIGYGIIELFLRDRKLTDIYIDGPIEQCRVYGVHSEYGSFESNVILSEREAQSFISRLRALSGRPFDEAHPVLDFDLRDLQTRIAVIGPPLSPDGVAFALRLHKTTPWTLPQLIDVKTIDPFTAGLLSFLIDVQSSTLINGSRGAGKTSMLTALMLEILPSLRILVQEDTQEIPVEIMKELGFHIQRLKTQSAIGVARISSEVSPEDALRTALRLGDSVLIVGEVRSKEAKVLYEAMRVGAVGNVVMGTIHGENAYSVWDRLVNDLGVPTTSFKATDIVVTCAPVRFKGSLKRYRRLIEITSIGKHWYHDPEKEGGLINIIEYDIHKDKHIFYPERFKNSELMKKIQKFRGLSFEEVLEEIKTRGEAKNYLVELKNKYNIPWILEAEYTVKAHVKYMLFEERMRELYGSVDHKELLEIWKKWVNNELVKKNERK